MRGLTMTTERVRFHVLEPVQMDAGISYRLPAWWRVRARRRARREAMEMLARVAFDLAPLVGHEFTGLSGEDR